MLTRTGQDILNKLYSDFSRMLAERSSVSNLNDVERGFLSMIGKAMIEEGVFSAYIFKELYQPRIDEIC